MRKFRNLNLLFADGDGTETGGGTDTGAAEGTDTATTTGTQTDTSKDAPTGAAEGTSTDSNTATGQESGQTETFDRAYVEKLRKENAATREKATKAAEEAAEKARTELTQTLGKALGLIKDDETADPEKIVQQAQAEREQAIAEAKSTKVELAVLRNADKHDANTDELLDSRDFAKKLKDLDPDADDFASQVDDLIKSAVEANPSRFKRVQVAAAAGGSTHSGEGNSADSGDKSIDDIRKERQKRRGME